MPKLLVTYVTVELHCSPTPLRLLYKVSSLSCFHQFLSLWISLKKILIIFLGYDRGETGSQLQMNQLSLRNNRLKFKTARKSMIILEEFIEYTPI